MPVPVLGPVLVGVLRRLALGLRPAAAVPLLHPQPADAEPGPADLGAVELGTGVLTARTAAALIGMIASPRRLSGWASPSGISPSAASADGSSMPAEER